MTGPGETDTVYWSVATKLSFLPGDDASWDGDDLDPLRVLARWWSSGMWTKPTSVAFMS
jgi:hypothetical protein